MIRIALALGIVWMFASVSRADDAPAKPRRKPDVGYYPTTQDVVEKMLELVRVTKQDHVFDLGCGDGRFMVTASRKYGCRSTGYEINEELIAKGRAEIRKLKLESLAKIEDQDLFTVDMSPASVAVLFLLPEMNAKLVPQLQKMKPGSRIITHEFDIPGIKPDQELTWISKEDNSEHLLYVYKVPLQPVKKSSQDSAPKSP